MDQYLVEGLKRDYDQIIDYWKKGDNIIEIYHLILYWIQNYKKIIKSQDDINDIYSRMLGNETADLIVLDFMYSEKYIKLRNECE